MAATILIVDDDANVRELLKLHLGAAGYEVHTAADAIQAGYFVLLSKNLASRSPALRTP